MENGGRLAMTSGHGLSLPVSSSQVSRKEWKRGNEHVLCDAGSQEQERTKLTQSDEKTIYEVQQGSWNLHADFSSLAIDASRVNEDPLQQRLQDITKQREELQHMEVEVRARLIAMSEVMEMRKNFESQVKDHVDAYAKLKEEFHEREKHIHNLEKNIESKERELRAIKLDNEKAWAKEDLLREQNIELATFRRERDNSDAERAQLLAQIHELETHLQEKERQSLELEEQHRVVQETIMYKDGQLRDLQAWIARIQEVDAFQATANHSLQAELRERTDQYNQLWLGFQRQVADMERHHFQTVHQLQAELEKARERHGVFIEDGNMTRVGDKESSQYVQQVGNQFDLKKDDTGSSSTIAPNAKAENSAAFDPSMNISPKIDHTHGVTVPSSSVFAVSNLIPTGHVTSLHPYVMHQQDLTQTVASANSHMPQIHMGNFPLTATVECTHYGPNQQAVAENSMSSNTDKQQPPSQIGPSSHWSPIQFGYQSPAEGNATPASSLVSQHDSHQAPATGISGSTENKQVLDPNKANLVLQGQNYIQETSHFNDSSLKVSAPDILEEKAFAIEHKIPPQGDVLKESDQPSQIFTRASFQENNYHEKAGQVSITGHPQPGPQVSVNDLEHPLMDERSLLASIVRAIPAGAGGRIRISSTLPNRLAKMLYPLHWNDYKRKYGKLDDFVGCHPELFVIDGDFIHLREGAQAIMSATAAVAKVAAAAAAASLPCLSASLSTVSITPTAQIRGVRKVSSFIPTRIDLPYPPQNGVQSVPADASGDPSHPWAVQNKELPGSIRSNKRILSNQKDVSAQNGYPKEVKLEKIVLPENVGTIEHSEKANLNIPFHKMATNERRSANTGGRQTGRVPVAGFSSKS